MNTSEITKSVMTKNEFVKHNLEIKHSFDFKDFKILIIINNKSLRKIVESSIFCN